MDGLKMQAGTNLEAWDFGLAEEIWKEIYEIMEKEGEDEEDDC